MMSSNKIHFTEEILNLPKKNNQEWGARHIVRVGRGEDSKRFPKVRYWHLHIGHTPLLTSGRKQELRRNVENLKKSNYIFDRWEI